MATVKAIIRNGRVNAQGKSIVYLRFGHKGKSVDLSTRIKVDPKTWSTKKGKVDSTLTINKSDKNEMALKNARKYDVLTNQEIENEKLKILSVVRQLNLEEKDPDIHSVKRLYTSELGKVEQSLKNLCLDEVWNDFILKSSVNIKTIEKYRNALLHFTEFQKYKSQRFKLTDLNKSFYDEFFRFLTYDIQKPDKSHGLAINTVGTTIKNLKVLLTSLIQRGYPIDIKVVSDMKAPKLTKEVIFLTEEEIDILRFFPFENERLQKVRDVFVFNCFAGLRYSDLKRLNHHHIKENAIQLRAYKNQKDIYVPLTTIPKEILEKYEYCLPIISEQKFNDYIKEACEIAGLFRLVERVDFILGKKLVSAIPLYKLVSSHIAVKTFITLCGKKNIPAKVVAEITGKTVSIIICHYYGIDKATIDNQMLKAFG